MIDSSVGISGGIARGFLVGAKMISFWWLVLEIVLSLIVMRLQYVHLCNRVDELNSDWETVRNDRDEAMDLAAERKAERNEAYAERNRLVAKLSAIEKALKGNSP